MLQQENFKENLLETYDIRTVKLSPDLQAWYEWFEFYTDKVYGTILKDVDKDAPILDLGCSRGGLLRALSLQGYSHLSGVDLSLGDLKLARRYNPEINFYHQNIFEFLKENPNTFKVIFLKALIEHIDKDKIPVLLELINSSLVDSGIVIIDVYNAAYILSQHDRYMDFTHEVGFTKESLSQVMGAIFSNTTVDSIPSPLILGFKDRIRYRIARKLFETLVHWMEPETRSLSFLHRLLIGVATKNKN